MKPIDPPSWSKIEKILDTALELSGPERDTYLDQVCVGNAELRGQVQALLNADERSQEFLARPAAELVGEMLERPEAVLKTPGRVGPYHVLREIGHGGMGTVYLAERDDGQFDQRVALKLVKAGSTHAEIYRRFLQERQILARLQHPNIARLLDGGVTQDGLPYFAMEYVEGTPVTDYCDAKRLDVNRRIDLFLDVCRAVQYAHRSLIVHRDLKPGNILVTDVGEVKLLDFGIAKLLDEGQPGIAQTQTAMRLMTPEYASPEQVRSDAITTATDVYALGLVLYQLLSGHKPYRLESPTPLQMQRAVLEQEPTRPSRAIGVTTHDTTRNGKTNAITPAQVSRLRRTSEVQLRRVLGGDLDNICLMALRKEPEQRYASAEAMREDLVRFRSNLPVLASRGTTGYRVRKYLRRNRAQLLATGAILLTLLGGLAASIWQARVASAERDRSREAEAKATAIKDFLVDEMIKSAAPEIARGRQVTVLEVLESVSNRIDGAFSGQPALEASVRATLGQSYLSLGQYTAAQEQLERAYDQFESVLGASDPESLRVARMRAEVLVGQGDYDGARSLAGATMQTQRLVLGPESLDALASERVLADALRRSGDYIKAEEHLRKILDVQQRAHPAAWQARLDVMTTLLAALEIQRKNSEAEAFAVQTLTLQRRHLGPDHPDVAQTMSLRGAALRRLEMFDEAQAVLEETLELQRRILGEAHTDTLETASRLGSIHWQQGRPADAYDVWSAAVSTSREALGEANPVTLGLRANLIIALRSLGRESDAEREFHETLRLIEETHGVEHPQWFKTQRALAGFLWNEDRHDEARAEFRELIDVNNRTADRPAADATALNDFAWFLLTCPASELQHPERALELSERAVELTNRKWAAALDTLAMSYYRTGRLDKAIAAQREVTALPDSVYRYDNERSMVLFLKAKGDPDVVEQFLRQNLERRRRMRSEDDSLIGTSLRMLGLHFLEQDHLDAAEENLRSALAQFERCWPEGHWRLGRVMVELGNVRLRREDFEGAETLMLRGHAQVVEDNRALADDRRYVVDHIIRLYDAWNRPEQAAEWIARRSD